MRWVIVLCIAGGMNRHFGGEGGGGEGSRGRGRRERVDGGEGKGWRRRGKSSGRWRRGKRVGGGGKERAEGREEGARKVNPLVIAFTYAACLLVQVALMFDFPLSGGDSR